MKRVLLIHQAFATPQEPGGTRHYELIQRCQGPELSFTVVASQNRYIDSLSVDGSGCWMSREDCAGIDLIRTCASSGHHKSFLRRMLAYLSFMCSSFFGAWKAGPVDLVWGTSPPIFQAVSAWLQAALRRRPFLLEVRDLWPEFAVDMGVLTNPVLIRLSRGLESFLYARADAILVNSPAYREYMLARGIPAAKVSLVANGVDTSQFDPDSRGEAMRRRWGVQDKFVATYAGALGPANAIGGILKAAQCLAQRRDIVFILMGAGKDQARLRQQAQDMGLTNVRFVGSLPKAEMPEALAASDTCIASLQNIPMFNTTYPNKVFDYMAAGRPVVLSIGGVIAEVVRSAGGGLLVPPEDDQAMAQAVERLAGDRSLCRQMGRDGRAYVEAHFERDHQARALAQVLGRAMKQ